MQCNDVQMVRFGTHMLAEEADDWWVSVQPVLEIGGTAVTWAVFRKRGVTSFLARPIFFPFLPLVRILFSEMNF